MVRFDPKSRLILVRGILFGPLGRVNLRLALDTGATRTTIDPVRLELVGLVPELSEETCKFTTASGIQHAPLVAVPRLKSVGTEHPGLLVLAYQLPPRAMFDGLLGLDFFQKKVLEIDFRKGTIVVK